MAVKLAQTQDSHIQVEQLAEQVYRFTSAQPFVCERGGVIEPWVLQYETLGKLNQARDNVILIHHALSTGAHVGSHVGNPKPGWWEAMIGSGKPIDTEQFFVICINNLGSCFGSSGATSTVGNGCVLGHDFPAVTITDMVHSQHQLLLALGIHKLFAVIGNSMGAMLSLTHAIHYPQTVERLVSVSSCYKSYPTNCAYRALAREIIQLDPAWAQGRYVDNTQLEGFKIARKMGHLTYRNKDELNQRFANAAKINHYLAYKAKQFSAYFDANSYLTLTQAMDWFDVTQGYEDPLTPFKLICAKTLVVTVTSDQLFPTEQQQDLADYLLKAKVDTKIIHNASHYGHDAFYADVEIAKAIAKFLH